MHAPIGMNSAALAASVPYIGKPTEFVARDKEVFQKEKEIKKEKKK